MAWAKRYASRGKGAKGHVPRGKRGTKIRVRHHAQKPTSDHRMVTTAEVPIHIMMVASARPSPTRPESVGGGERAGLKVLRGAHACPQPRTEKC